ncbi:c-type cytochrome [Hoeflea alexandrii]|uniref:c-type cytochrome n=1 Tax=Hoeflea alexandrii TaxID=288436 RepID=UPI0022AF21BD|nr:c-type cytochrome [Hoeflea alexandrii]MCZ4288248.1 c-type cytochrome [Hoeflea alexandrii]
MTMRKMLMAVLLLGAAVFVYRSLGSPETVPTGAALASVAVPDLSPAAREGEALFNRSCASCHGRNAAGQDGIAPPLIHKIYEPGHHGDMSFHLAARNGVRAHHWPFGNMPPVEGITDPELDKVVLYVRELQRANGIH